VYSRQPPHRLAGTPLPLRHLGGLPMPYVENRLRYGRWRVVKPIDCHKGVAAPWFDMPGAALNIDLKNPFLGCIKMDI